MSARRWIVAGVLIVLLLAGGHAMAKRHTARWTAMSGQPPDCIACHVQPMMTPSAHDAGYKTPTCLAVSADGGRLLATGRDADALIVVDLASCLGAGSASAEPASGAIREVAVGREPEGVAFSPDGKVVYVANRREDSVSVVDAGSWHETGRFPVGDEPCGLATDARGTVLYVANAASDSVSVVDLEKGIEIKRLAGGRDPYAVKLAPDRRTIWVTNRITNRVPSRTIPIAELTLIDTRTQTVRERRELPSAHLIEDLTFTPEGDLALVTLVRPKNLLPATQLDHGWMVTSGIGVIETRAGGRAVQILLDDWGQYYPDPYGVSVTPDGRYAFVTASAADVVHIIDMPRLRSLLAEATDQELASYGNDLGVSAEYVVKRLKTRPNPKDVVASPDGRYVFVAERLGDSIAVIDAERLEITHRIGLGGPPRETMLRRGERIFNASSQTLYGQHSCRTCHCDGHMDGLTYDFEPDGLAREIVDNRTLRGIAGTAPFKWTGKNVSTMMQCGPRFARWLTRLEPFEFHDLVALAAFMDSQRLPPNRYKGDGGLTEAQLRGKALFERDTDNEGRHIPLRNRCIGCHSGPLATDNRVADVGTGSRTDKYRAFDTPSLVNIYDTPPYLHDGRAQTLEEIWTLFNGRDTHGVTNDMNKQDLNDLIEYLKTL